MDGSPPERSSSSPSHYRRIATLGRGGFAEVELVVREEGRFQRLYARKRLIKTHQDDLELKSMFLEEARLAGMLRHPNVVSVLDVGEDEQGSFLLMDYIDGTSVFRLLQVAVKAEEEIPLQVCLRIVIDAAEGLHGAHELTDRESCLLNLVHRDVSPANLLVGYDGITRVTDFGIAKALGQTSRTSTGILKGKYGYMSPEQLRFEEPDRRSDIFALGVVLFELLTRRRLYANKVSMDGARRILNEPPPDVADFRDDVPEALVELMFTLLAKDPANRPATAKGVARRLAQILDSLEAEEGLIDVSSYLSRILADDRSNQQQRISAALSSPSALSVEAKPASLELELEVVADHLDPGLGPVDATEPPSVITVAMRAPSKDAEVLTPRSARKPISMKTLFLVALGMLTMFGAALLWALDPRAQRDEVPNTIPAKINASSAELAAPPAVGHEIESPRDIETPGEVAAPSSVETPRDPAVVREAETVTEERLERHTRPPRRKSPRKAKPPEQVTGVPTWKW